MTGGVRTHSNTVFQHGVSLFISINYFFCIKQDKFKEVYLPHVGLFTLNNEAVLEHKDNNIHEITNKAYLKISFLGKQTLL